MKAARGYLRTASGGAARRWIERSKLGGCNEAIDGEVLDAGMVPVAVLFALTVLIPVVPLALWLLWRGFR